MKHRRDDQRHDTVLRVAIATWVAMLIAGTFLVYYVF